MIKISLLLIILNINFIAYCQSDAELIGKVELDSLVKTVREFSGEDNCMVRGSKVRILNRVSSSGNDLAADYLEERLDSIDGISVTSDVYSAGGRNVYGTQLGTVFPDSIVMICGHYDAVADYCADDNASAVGILLEAARILSKYQFKKTIVYAFWDEEEIGLLGSKHHALQSKTNGDKYVAVLNIDMAGYDSNDDGIFDIDLNTNAGSIKMKDDLVAIRSTNSLNITPTIVQPGTTETDHASFWTFRKNEGQRLIK
jgi:Zn-dependent M28 family amino/carboxypeptidase